MNLIDYSDCFSIGSPVNASTQKQLPIDLAKGSIETIHLTQEALVCHLTFTTQKPISLHFSSEGTHKTLNVLMNLRSLNCDLTLDTHSDFPSFFKKKKLTLFSAQSYQLHLPPQKTVNLVLLKAKNKLIQNYFNSETQQMPTLFSTKEDSFIRHLQSGPHLAESLAYFYSFQNTPVLNRMKLHLEVLKFWNAILFENPSYESTNLLQYNKNSSAMVLAKDYILRNLDKPLTIAQIARFICQSESSLKRNFKTAHGLTIYQFIQSSRIWKAKELFDTGNYNVKQVAHQIGYSNISHFSKAFKKHLSHTPSVYLKRSAKI